MNLYEILQNSDRVGEGMTHFERLFAQKVGGGSAVITGVPPLRYIGDGRPLTDYLISGNTVQNGTPSADAPVDVIGCGAWDETRQSYKLPLTVNGVEHPIYLGTVPTTRRIKKLVLTGEGFFGKNYTDPNNTLFYFNFTNYHFPFARSAAALCTHLDYSETLPSSVTGIRVSNLGATVYINFGADAMSAQPSGNTVAGLKEYLAAQYAAGTPVTIWYVLAEPETAVVNEPLMKIDDYADTVSFAQAGVTIPTANGANVLDVPTEVKPSEVWIRGRIKEV